jgi:GAF domain
LRRLAGGRAKRALRKGAAIATSVHIQVLVRAAEILGGTEALRGYLRVSPAQLAAWMAGRARPPAHIFLRAVDLISEKEAPRRRATDARESAERMRAALLESPAVPVARRRSISAEDFASAEFSPSDGRRMIETALNAAVDSTAAQRGNVQLVAGQGLRIVAYLGFEQPFLDFFARVEHQASAACGAALKLARRVIVPDVAADPLFAGTAAAAVMENAHCRAVQSTPLMGAAGEVIGMLSTHYEKPHQPSVDELAAIDLVARRASYWLGGAP